MHLTLLQVGFTEPRESPRTLVVSYTTVSPLLSDADQWSPSGSGLFSVALSRGSPRVGVTHHLALWSPDLPRHAARRIQLRNAVARPTRPPYQSPYYSRSAYRLVDVHAWVL